MSSIKFSFEFYVGSYTLLFWLPSLLCLYFDKILTIQTLIITFKPAQRLNDSKYKKKSFQSNFLSIKFFFEMYVDSYTLLLWFSSNLHLKLDEILTIQTLIITFKPLYF